MTKTAVVTGASAGIGGAAAIEQAKAGHDGGVYDCRHQNEARETAQGVESSGWGRGPSARVILRFARAGLENGPTT